MGPLVLSFSLPAPQDYIASYNLHHVRHHQQVHAWTQLYQHSLALTMISFGCIQTSFAVPSYLAIYVMSLSQLYTYMIMCMHGSSISITYCSVVRSTMQGCMPFSWSRLMIMHVHVYNYIYTYLYYFWILRSFCCCCMAGLLLRHLLALPWCCCGDGYDDRLLRESIVHIVDGISSCCCNRSDVGLPHSHPIVPYHFQKVILYINDLVYRL